MPKPNGAVTVVPGEVTVVRGETRPGQVTVVPGEVTVVPGEVTVVPGEVTTVVSGERRPRGILGLGLLGGDSSDDEEVAPTVTVVSGERRPGLLEGLVNVVGEGVTTIVDGIRGGAEGTFDLARQILSDPLRTAEGAVTLGSRLVSNEDRLRFIRLGWFWLNGKLYNRDGFQINFNGDVVGPKLSLRGAIEGGISGAVNLAGAIGGDALRLATGGLTLNNGLRITEEMRLRFMRLGWFVIDGVLYNAQGLRIDLDGNVIGGALDLAGEVGGRILQLGAGAVDLVGNTVGSGLNFLTNLGGDSQVTVVQGEQRPGLQRPGLFGGLV